MPPAGDESGKRVQAEVLHVSLEALPLGTEHHFSRRRTQQSRVGWGGGEEQQQAAGVTEIFAPTGEKSKRILDTSSHEGVFASCSPRVNLTHLNYPRHSRGLLALPANVSKADRPPQVNENAKKKEHDGNPRATHSQQREHPRGPEGRGMRGPQPLGEVADDPDGSLEDVVVLLSIRRQLLKR